MTLKICHRARPALNGMRPWLAALCLIGGTAGAHTVRAQEEQSAVEEARALFREGIELIDQERWDEAAEVFRSALALHDAPTIVYNLGIALSHSGRLIEAAESLRRLRDDASADAGIRADARRQLGLIEPRIGHLNIMVEGDAEGTELAIDGRVVDAGAGPVAVDPGTHTVALRRNGTALAEETVEVADGASVDVALAAVPTARETAERAQPTPETPLARADQGSGEITSEPWFWTVIGVAVLAVVGGVVAGAVVAGGGGSGQPIQGNLDPPFLDVLP